MKDFILLHDVEENNSPIIINVRTIGQVETQYSEDLPSTSATVYDVAGEVIVEATESVEEIYLMLNN